MILHKRMIGVVLTGMLAFSLVACSKVTTIPTERYGDASQDESAHWLVTTNEGKTIPMSRFSVVDSGLVIEEIDASVGRAGGSEVSIVETPYFVQSSDIVSVERWEAREPYNSMFVVGFVAIVGLSVWIVSSAPDSD